MAFPFIVSPHRHRIGHQVAATSRRVATAPAPPAGGLPTGGTITVDQDGYVVHTFTASGTFDPGGFDELEVEVLVVGGGGGGGTNLGGGGGSGDVRSISPTVTSTQAVTVGAGGAADTNGGSSSFGATTAPGGGAGGAIGNNGSNGGSGGGGGGSTGSTRSGGTATGTNGNNGGSGGSDAASSRTGGGGGGCGGIGQSGNSGGSNNAGGAGYDASSFGLGTIAGGGGGGSDTSGGSGNGGGGDGGTWPGGGASDDGTAALSYGSGGGGGSRNGGAGGSGGDGVVIVRWALPVTGGTITIDDDDLVHTFTASGTLELVEPGTLPVAVTFTGTGDFGGITSDDTTDVTDDVTVTVTSGTVIVTYDPTAFTSVPIPTAALALWLDADEPSSISSSGGVVTGWSDLSGNGRDLTAPGTGPQTGAETLNGRNVLTFNDTDYLSVPSALLSALDAAGEGEIFYVAEGDWDNGSGTPTNGAPIQGGTGNALLSHTNFQDGNFYMGWGTDTRKNCGNPTPSLAAARIINIRSEAGSYVVEIDGAAFYSTGTNTPDWTGGPTNSGATVGMQLGTNTGANCRWHGKIAEVIVYESVLSTGDRASVEAYLSDKWGVAV